jgi:RNA polymerase sigma-70 factor (ECF subfamily)
MVTLLDEERFCRGIYLMSDQNIEEMISSHRARLLTFAMRMIGNPSDAEDLVQTAILNALEAEHKPQDPPAISTWLYRITYHLCINHLTRARIQRKAYQLWAHQRIMATTDEPAQRELKTILRQAVDRLKSPLRDIIILHFMQHLSYDQVSEVLGMPLGTVKVYARRALVKLRKILKPFLREVSL